MNTKPFKMLNIQTELDFFLEKNEHHSAQSHTSSLCCRPKSIRLFSHSAVFSSGAC